MIRVVLVAATLLGITAAVEAGGYGVQPVWVQPLAVPAVPVVQPVLVQPQPYYVYPMLMERRPGPLRRCLFGRWRPYRGPVMYAPLVIQQQQGKK